MGCDKVDLYYGDGFNEYSRCYSPFYYSNFGIDFLLLLEEVSDRISLKYRNDSIHIESVANNYLGNPVFNLLAKKDTITLSISNGTRGWYDFTTGRLIAPKTFSTHCYPKVVERDKREADRLKDIMGLNDDYYIKHIHKSPSMIKKFKIKLGSIHTNDRSMIE